MPRRPPRSHAGPLAAIALTAAVAVTGLSACKRRQAHDDSGVQAWGPAQRKLLGLGAEYAADPRPTAALKAALGASLVQRRAFGWDVVRKALRPVALSTTARPASGAELPRVPAMLTWYTAGEARKIFRRFYKTLRLRQREGACTAGGDACDLPALARDALAAYSTQAHLDDGPTALFDLLAKQLAEPGNAADALAAGLGKNSTFAKNVVLFNSRTVLHFLTHYDAIGRCLARYKDAPPPVVEPGRTVDDFGSCFGAAAPFPVDAVTVKTRWERLYEGAQIKSVPTDAAALLAAFATGDGGWKAAAGHLTPLPGRDRALTVRVKTGSATTDFALVAVHITTKEVPEWVWVSLWWSDEPDTDFGADRPTSLCVATSDAAACAADDLFLAPLRHYKMCVASAFHEDDPALARPIAPNDPLAPLLRPLQAVYRQTGGATWCSNQYLEEGPGETRSNCVGCHQFAAPGATFDRGLPGGATQNVLAKAGNNFPADFMWSFSNGDDLGHAVDDARQDIDGLIAQGQLGPQDLDRDD